MNIILVYLTLIPPLRYTISKSKMISRRQEEGDEARAKRVEGVAPRTLFVEGATQAPGIAEADDAANKDSALIEK